MENAATDRATPTTVNSSVRTREYLTTAEKTYGRYRPGSATRTSSTRCAMPNSRRTASRISGGTEPHLFPDRPRVARVRRFGKMIVAGIAACL